MIVRLFSIVASSFQAFAAEPPIVRCKGIPGCDSPPANVLATSVVPAISSLLLEAAAAGAILAIIWGGFLMVFSNGDDAKAGNGRKSITFGLGGLALALSASSLVSFVVTENFGQGGGGGDFVFSSFLPAFVRIARALFNVAVAVVVIIAGFRMAISQGKQDAFHKGGTTILWAFIGAIIVNAARAIVEAFVNRTISW